MSGDKNAWRLRRLPCLLLALALLFAVDRGRAAAYHEEGADWTYGSAYTLRGGEISLGLLRWEVGLIDEIMIGTSPILWAASAFVHSLVPNGYVKLRDSFDGPFTLSVEGRILYVNGTELLEDLQAGEDSQANLLSLNLSVSGSMRFSPEWIGTLSVQLNEVGATGQTDMVAFRGATVLDTITGSAVAQWNLSQVAALRLSGTAILYREQPVADVEFDASETTHVEADLRLGRVVPVGAFQLVPSLLLSFSHINLALGAGYGWRWIPMTGLTMGHGLVIDFDFFVRL